jgi:hypothetical protein
LKRGIFYSIINNVAYYNLVLLIEATILIRLMQDKDNRKNERISIQAKAMIGTNGLFGNGLLMDFSKKGLGLILDYNEFIDIGQKLNIMIETSPTPTTVQGVIKWVRRFGEWEPFDCAVGMELVDFDIVRYGNSVQHIES